MKLIQNIEQFFKKNIEGFFNHKFSSSLQPVEIAKKLIYIMEDNKSIGVSQIYVPNHYLICMNETDYSRLQPYFVSIQSDISQYLINIATEKKYSIIGKPIIEIEKADDITEGNFRAAASFSEPIPAEETAVPENDHSQTLVFNRMESVLMPQRKITAKLSVIEGIDKGFEVLIAASRINIGRRETNEFPLADMNTSRLHAYILFEEECHILYDAKSLNGTYVNDHRITRKHLKPGDRIRVGHTSILYEVK